MLGDSLSVAYGVDTDKGWVSLLQKKLATFYQSGTLNQKWKLVNASVNGETTSGGLARLPALLKQYQPNLCVVELGTNNGLRGMSIKSMRADLDHIITQCKQFGKVLLVGMKLPPNYGEPYTQAFEESFGLAAEKHQTSLIPFLLENVALNPTLMQADEFHPTATAQPYLLENVLPTLLPLLQP